MTEEKAWGMRSSWILPSGYVKIVTHEQHDYELPKQYKSVEVAEKACVRVSCAWGWTAPISYINIPKRPTEKQVKVLIDLNLAAEPIGIEKCAEFLFSDVGSWKEMTKDQAIQGLRGE